MARVSTYLNFSKNTEEAFTFYKEVFKTKFSPPGIRRFGDFPPPEGAPQQDAGLANLVMHVELPILGGHLLMGTDAPPEMGFTVNFGNNSYINLEPDTREETERLFDALANGGTVEMPLQEMFWGYFGSLTDKFGVRWMFNFSNQQP